MDKTMRSIKVEDTSSAYSSSKESINEQQKNTLIGGISPPKSENGSTCSCGKSNSNRSLSTQKYFNGGMPIEARVKKKKSSQHSHSSSQRNTNSVILQKESLTQINEKLVRQNRFLQEQNQSLLEELQVSRRFYQGTLADLQSQLSIAENRIKYLKEVVSVYEEGIVAAEKKEDEKANFQRNQVSDSRLCTYTHDTIIPLRKHSKQIMVNAQISSHLTTDTPRATRSVAGSTSSEISQPKSRLGSRQRGNFAKMKEHLLEKNQKMKTDIEKLKVRSEILPHANSVPILMSSQKDGTLATVNQPIKIKGTTGNPTNSITLVPLNVRESQIKMNAS